MRRIKLCDGEKNDVLHAIMTYTAKDKIETKKHVRIYKCYRFVGYSSVEIAGMEKLHRSTVYRIIIKVDRYIENVLRRDKLESFKLMQG